MAFSFGKDPATNFYGDGTNIRSVIMSREVIVHRHASKLRVLWEMAMFALRLRRCVSVYKSGVHVRTIERRRKRKEVP